MMGRAVNGAAKAARQRNLASMRADPSHRSHGTTYGYACGCCCDRCRAAGEHARRTHELRRADADAAELRELFKRYRERNGR